MEGNVNDDIMLDWWYDHTHTVYVKVWYCMHLWIKWVLLEGCMSMLDITYSFLAEPLSVSLYGDLDFYQLSSAWIRIVLIVYSRELIEQEASFPAKWISCFLRLSKKWYFEWVWLESKLYYNSDSNRPTAIRHKRLTLWKIKEQKEDKIIKITCAQLKKDKEVVEGGSGERRFTRKIRREI